MAYYKNAITCTTTGNVTFRVNGTDYTVPAGTHTLSFPEAPTSFNIVADKKNLVALDASQLDVSNFRDMSKMFLSCYKLQTLDLSGWDVSNVTDMSAMFNECSALSSIKGIEDWDVSNVKDMHKMFNRDGIFSGQTSYGSLDLSGWDVSNVKDMHDMFAGCASLTKLDITGWNTANVTDMSSMFDGCSNLTTLDGISNFDTSKAIGMSSMFRSCHKLTTLDLSGWDVSNVTDMSAMFNGCTALPEIKGIENWNTGNVARMDDMFSEGTSLKSLNLSGWNTSNVETMYYMFNDCNAITELDVSGWNTAKVTDMHSMFKYCQSLAEIKGLSDWDVSNVKNMNYMFLDCNSLTSIHGIKNWNVSIVNDMREMFSGCNKLTTLDVSGWNTRYVVDMNGMFDRCNSISYLDLSKWNTANVENMGGMFQKCGALTTLNLNGWNMENVESKEGLFADCKSLTSVITKGCDVKTIRQLSEECPKTAVLSNDERAATPVEKASQKGKGQTAEDRALDLFADMMIEKIKSLSSTDNWKKPWFTEGSMLWPKNLAGREYNGMNALMLMMHCEKNDYKLPVFMTFDRVANLNFQKDKQGKRSSVLDDKGEPLPHVGVNKGEKSFPVFITTFTCIDKDTKEKIKFDDYKQMSDEDKKNVNVYPKLQVYNVFNVSQTNLKEARPELYAKLEAENQVVKAGIEGDDYSFPPMDKMIKEQRWICPINVLHQDSAYYSISKDSITVPEKSQFKDGESFYTNLWHEMAHSSGSEKYLNRLKPSGGFGSAEYSREELIAELSSALVSSRYGLTKNLKEDSAAYLKSWLDNIKESPDFIKTVLFDVKKASSMITQRVDEIALEIDNAKEQTQEQANAVTNETEKVPEQKVFYASVQYLQMADDTQRFDNLTPEQIIQEGQEYDNGDAIDLENTHSNAIRYPHDDIIAEDEHYAVVCNNSVGGTIEIFRKVPEQEVRDTIDRYGLPHDATEDVKSVAKAMVREQFEELSKDKMLAIEKPNGEVVYFHYNQDSDKIEVGNYTNSGMMVDFSVPYDHDYSMDANLQNLNDLISEQATEQVDNHEDERISAKLPPTSLSEEPESVNRAALDEFMTDYYWAARRDNNFRMSGFVDYNGKEALKLTNDSSNGTSYYLVSREAANTQLGEQQDKFFMHLYDAESKQEIFKSREMPHDRNDAYSFLRGAFKELQDYEYEKQMTNDQSADVDESRQAHFGR